MINSGALHPTYPKSLFPAMPPAKADPGDEADAQECKVNRLIEVIEVLMGKYLQARRLWAPCLLLNAAVFVPSSWNWTSDL